MTTIQMPNITTSKIFGRLGTTYTPDANGLITVTDAYDVLALHAAGGVIQSTMGSGSSGMSFTGPINKQISAAGVAPGATGADNVLAFFSVPASSLDSLGRGIDIVAAGTFGATGNNKRVKIIINPATAVVGSTVGASGVTVADTAVVATNAGGWTLRAQVFKYGVAGANTQLGINLMNQTGATTPVLIAPAAITATESGAILVAVTGNATTATTDILFNFMLITAIN